MSKGKIVYNDCMELEEDTADEGDVSEKCNVPYNGV